jgi:sugar phosphate isomerase/epimerase
MTSAFLRTPTVNGNWRLWRDSKIVRSPLPAESYGIDAALADAAKIRGLRNLTVVLLLPEERETLDDYRRFADSMNSAGERCRQAGFSLSYHPHAFDYATVEGRVAMEVLLERFQPEYVRFEIDVFWMIMGGWDPVAFMRQHGSRVSGLHLKDRASTAPPLFLGNPWDIPVGATVPVGDGNLNFKTLLDHASAASIRYAYVEDESEGDRFQNLAKGLVHLRLPAA